MALRPVREMKLQAVEGWRRGEIQAVTGGDAAVLRVWPGVREKGPRVPRTIQSKTRQGELKMQYKCSVCGYVYDEENEDVAFADLSR